MVEGFPPQGLVRRLRAVTPQAILLPRHTKPGWFASSPATERVPRVLFPGAVADFALHAFLETKPLGEKALRYGRGEGMTGQAHRALGWTAGFDPAYLAYHPGHACLVVDE